MCYRIPIDSLYFNIEMALRRSNDSSEIRKQGQDIDPGRTWKLEIEKMLAGGTSRYAERQGSV